MTTINSFNSLNAGQIGPLKLTGDGVYTAEALAPTGEKMYFAMESIEDGDKNKWEIYKNTATLLVQGGCGDDFTIGSLVELGSRINDEVVLKEFLATQTRPNYWTSDPQKFEQLSASLRKRQIMVDSAKAKDLSTIPHASNGMNVKKQTHVVYVSKSPITGRSKFTSASKGFGAYADKYGDVIMTVGVTISDAVENRGIFRNPLSIVEGGYGGIAMMVHSFTCMAVQESSPSVNTFRVRPMKKMGELFLDSLPKDQITIEGICGDLYDGGFEREKDVKVPVEVLANLHRAK